MKQPIRIIYGGRGKGKMMALEEFLKLLPEDKRKDVVIVRASDPVPELKGNKLPRIVGYDMMETSEPTWKLWEKVKSALKVFEMKSKKTTSGYQVLNKNNDGIRYYSSSLTDCIKYCPFGCAVWSTVKRTYGIKLRFFWMSPFRKIWYDKYSDVVNFFHIHIGWELMKGEVPVEIVYEPKDEPRKEF